MIGSAENRKKIEIIKRGRRDWNYMARVIFGVTLDPEQQKILEAIQHNRRVSVRSGNARGKDYVSAVAALCFLYANKPSLVVLTAPTGRQVVSVMMKEISRIHHNAPMSLGGEVLTQEIKFPRGVDRHLIGFKAADKSTEAWTGFHSANMMVLVTEASGPPDETFNNIESILTGDQSKEVLIFNPHRVTGEAARSARSKRFVHFQLNCMNAPNVVNKKTLYPGQCDWEWVNDKVDKWCRKVSADEYKNGRNGHHDFEWEGSLYRPNNDYLVKVMGEFPREDPDTLIPYAWVQAANERYNEYMEKKRLGQLETVRYQCTSCNFAFMVHESEKDPKCRKCGDKTRQIEYTVRIKEGVDVAGQGRDNTVYTRLEIWPDYSIVTDITVEATTDHMGVVARIKERIGNDKTATAYIDTIGEGAGVYSRCAELGINAISVKFSHSAKGYFDLTGQKKFKNMRAYCYHAIRDALDPQLGGNLMFAECPELTEDLTALKIKPLSSGEILLNPKEEIKERLGRSTDWGDSLANSYYPAGTINITFG